MADVQWWVPHETEVFLPGKHLREDGETNTYLVDSGEIQLPKAKQLDQVGDPSALTGVDDICSLEVITPPALLHSVRVRYQRDQIYTNISRILVAVNPFKPLSIYEDQYIELYQSAADPASLPPHVFGVGADVFQRLTHDKTSQAVLISGESGAGKTESTKLMLLYISQAFSSDAAGGGFEDSILEINPILEAFGNAKTGRNNNSSRFGKWIEVLADPSSFRFHGASVTDYLLEVTRVCSQGPGERNYHIFYQLLGDNSGDLDELKLSGGVESFEYLKANPADVPGLNDKEDLNMLRKALVGLKFSSEDQDAIFRIVAGILHLGNVSFTPSADQAKVANEDVLSDAAQLLGCSPKTLASCVSTKRIMAGKDVAVSPLGDEAACRARDSIAKLIYSRLFKWLVERCNTAFKAMGSGEIGKGEPACPYIGVLDIAGFESFQTNSLEQMFINLSNEKLQQFFNSYVFKTELDLYSKEGINVDKVDFADNAEILTLIEGKGGILTMLDDSTTGIKQTDGTYTTQVVKAHEKHSRFIKPKFPNQPVFTIRHFAGDVLYTTTGFLEKNVAQQPPEVLEMMASSELAVLKELAVEPEVERAGAAPGRVARKATVGSAFRKSLQQLVEKFGEAGAHFIRCVKPNTSKVPDCFKGDMVMEQLRLSGVMEAVKIRKAGYPVRLLMEDFVKRYTVLVSRALRESIIEGLSTDVVKASNDLFQVLSELLESQVNEGDYAVGKTKVFLRDGLYRMLEKYRRVALAGTALQIQQTWRGYHLRQVMKQVLEVYGALQKLLEDMDLLTGTTSLIEKQKRATTMEASLGQVDILLGRADRLPVKLPSLHRMLKARARIAAEANLARQMQNLVAAGSIDVAEMSALLARSADYKMKGGVVDIMQERCEKLREQLPQSRALKACVDLDLDEVQQVVDDAKGKGYDSAEKWIVPNGPALFEEALVRLQQLKDERREFEEQQRKAAAEAAALAAQKEAKASAAKQAASQATAQAKIKLLKKVGKATVELDAPALQEALCEAEELDVPEQDLAEAHSVFLNLQSGDFVQCQLNQLRRSGSQEPLDLLKKSNLIKQVEVLGLKVLPLSEEMREVTHQIITLQRSKTFDSKDPVQMEVAERCFEDLSNYSGLRDPQMWSRMAWRTTSSADALESGSTCPPAMLQWCADRIPGPLTAVDAKIAHLAVRNFSNLLRCMGDKPAVYIGNKDEPILSLARRTPALRDEIYLQIMKQLTGNPSAESAISGWRLLRALCGTASPSSEMCQFVKAFLQKAKRGDKDTMEQNQASTAMKSAVAEKRRKSFAVLMKNFVAEKPKLAAEALALLEGSSPEAAAEAQGGAEGQELVEVYTEDNTSRSLKFKTNWTLEDLKHRMLKVTSLRDGQGFEFFSFDPDEDRTPWRILPRTMNVQTAASKATVKGRCLLFGRVNVMPKEDLAADDLVRARLTFLHAVKQWRGYSVPLTPSHAKGVCVKIATALVAADNCTYSKKKRGKGHDRFNEKVAQFKDELEAGLTGEGVLERYVSGMILKACNREDLGKEILQLLRKPTGNVNEAGNFELLGKSRALALMQANLPDFDAYSFGPVTEVPPEEVKWDEIKWNHAPSRTPHGVFAALEARRQMEHDLLVSHEGIALQFAEADGWGLRVPFRSGVGRWHLTGWGAHTGEMLALSLYDRASESAEPAGVVLRTPEGMAEAAASLMTYFYS